MNPNRNKNLIPLNRRTEQERKEIATSGGKASGEARRNKATMKDIANHFLSLPRKKGRKIEFDKIKTLEDLEILNIDLKTLIVLQQLKKAAEGDLFAAKWIQQIIGEDFDQLEGISKAQEQEETASYMYELKKALDNMQIEGVDFEYNAAGERIPLKNGFPILEEGKEEKK